QDNLFCFTFSTAILRYLVQKYNTPDHWYPSDPQKRARVDEYLAWQHTTTRPNGCRVFWVKCMTPAILGRNAEADKLNQVLAEFIAVMKHLEETYLKDGLFLAGDEISLADLVAIVEIMQVVASGVPVFQQMPKLEAWKQRVEEALGPEVFKEAHEDILNVKEQQLNSLSPEVKEQLKGRLLLFTNCGMWLC
ncbi:unnamed protein product, partial [Staurois parvus]